jgi:hypothetical protein
VTATALASPVVRAIQDNKVSPGVLGFLVVAALGVATWLLIRSMNRQLHKIDFKEDAIDIERQRSVVPEADIAVEVAAAETDTEASPSAAEGDDSPK